MKILVAEDNVAQAESLGVILRVAGHVPFLAGDGNQAMAQVETHGCDAAIVDLMMPGMGGRALLTWLRGRPDTTSIPIVVSTGLPVDATALVGLSDVPGVTVLQKPFAVADLGKALGVVL